MSRAKLNKKLETLDKDLMQNLMEATAKTVGSLNQVIFGFTCLDKPTFFIRDYAKDPGFVHNLASSVAATFTFYISKLEKSKEPILFCVEKCIPQALYDIKSLVGHVNLCRQLGTYRVGKLWENLKQNNTQEPVFAGMEDTLLEKDELDPFLIRGFGVSKGNVFDGEDVGDIVNANLPRRIT